MIYSESKVPLLGDIPILGYLFKFTTQDARRRRNLLILLTPYIVKDQLDLEQIVERKVARAAASSCARSPTSTRSKYLPRDRLPPQARPDRGDQPHDRGHRAGGRDPEALEGNPPPPDGVIDIGTGSRDRRRAGAAGDRSRPRRRRTPGPVERRRRQEPHRNGIAAATAIRMRPDRACAPRRRSSPAARSPPLLGEILVRPAAASPADALARGLAKQREEGGLLGEVLVRMKADRRGPARPRAQRAGRDAVRCAMLPARRGHRADADRDAADRLRQAAPGAADRPRRGRAAGSRSRWPTRSRSTSLDDIAVLVGGAGRRPVLAAPTRIVELINKVYGRLRQGAELEASEKKDDEEDEEFADAEELVDILDANDEAPIIRWVNSLLFQAVKERASDIHIEPGEKDVMVRYRIDGVLREAKRAPRKFLAVDHGAREDHGRPQHRREAAAAGRPHPAQDRRQGHRHARRDRADRRRRAGHDPPARPQLGPARPRPTSAWPPTRSSSSAASSRGRTASSWSPGPTGSGKTTTLYACLSEINSPDLNILTVEDPVEYQLEGISQTQVNPKIELTFATGLRSFLRHDPDVIMVGEIRDRGDRRDRDHRVAHRPPRALHRPHQRRRRRHHPPGRHGHRAVPGRVVAGRPAGPAPGPPPVLRVRRAGAADRTRSLRELGLEPDRFFAGGYQLPEVKGARALPVGTVSSRVGCRRLPRQPATAAGPASTRC